MFHSIYLSLTGVIINQIPLFYDIFRKFNDRWLYSYNLKGVHFMYFKSSCSLYIRTTTDKILGKHEVGLDDLDEFMDKLKSIIMELVNIKEENLTLNLCRIDFKVDLKLSQDEMDYIFVLLNKHRTKYKYIKSKQKYSSSIHLSSPKGSKNINIYDKGMESELPEFKNVLRVEVQLKNRGLFRFYKTNGVERNIINYWNKDEVDRQFLKYLESFLYKGDYYKLNKTKEIILNSSYSNTIKKGLVKFVTIVNRYGMTSTYKYMSYNSVGRYIDLLNKLDVCPITIDDSCKIDKIDSIYKRIKKYIDMNNPNEK